MPGLRRLTQEPTGPTGSIATIFSVRRHVIRSHLQTSPRAYRPAARPSPLHSHPRAGSTGFVNTTPSLDNTIAVPHRRPRPSNCSTRVSAWRHTCVREVMGTRSPLPSTGHVPTRRIWSGLPPGWCTGPRPLVRTRHVCLNASSPTSRTRRWATVPAWASFDSPGNIQRLAWKPPPNERS